LEQQIDLERKQFYTDMQASQAEKNELLIQNSNLDAEKLELVEEKIYLKNKQILSAENEELFHKVFFSLIRYLLFLLNNLLKKKKIFKVVHRKKQNKRND